VIEIYILKEQLVMTNTVLTSSMSLSTVTSFMTHPEVLKYNICCTYTAQHTFTFDSIMELTEWLEDILHIFCILTGQISYWRKQQHETTEPTACFIWTEYEKMSGSFIIHSFWYGTVSMAECNDSACSQLLVLKSKFVLNVIFLHPVARSITQSFPSVFMRHF
jgi:hypothetical protein